MNTVSVRPLASDDLPDVGDIVEENEMFPREMLDSMVAPYLADPHGEQRWCVAERGGAVCGVAYHVPEALTEGTRNLLLIAVTKRAHRGGIGAALMAAVEQECAAIGTRLLLVETSGTKAFAGTRAFYDCLRYHREAVIGDFYAEGDDKVIYSKRL